MPEREPLTAQELQHGVQLLLEHYQRCGLTHLPSHVDPAQIQAMLSAIRAEQISDAGGGLEPIDQHHRASSRAAASPKAASPTTQRASSSASNPTKDKVAVSHGLLTDEATATTRLTSWNLPVIALDDRRSRLDILNDQVKSCRLCSDIVSYRQQTVFGDGTLQPTICFFGEAPGADEDREGKPFIGKAGQLLDRIIEAMSLKRSDVYILNALKCRPPQNRTPVPDEIDNCRQFAEAQLEILQPRFIVCLGAVAVRSLLGTNDSVGRLRGRFHQYRSARVVVTYHPAYLLRNETAKKFVWEDMQMLMRELGIQPVNPKQ